MTWSFEVEASSALRKEVLSASSRWLAAASCARLSLRWLLDRARARQGDADAKARAVERCRNFVAGELPTEIAQDTLLALVELGSQPAIELLLERLSEFQNWENYRAVRALREHVERPEVAAAILRSFREPALL